MESLQITNDKLEAAKRLTAIIYALQAASFLLGITFVVALVINYVKSDDVKGTWLESHFKWQIRTFWFSLLWFVVGFSTFFLVIGYFVMLANTVWLVYRIAKGWLNLNDGKSM